MTSEFSLRSDIKGYESLEKLALNLRWSWNHRSDQVWEQLDPVLWNLTQNPWVVLQTASREKLVKSLSDPSFCELVDSLLQSNQQADTTPAWFQKLNTKYPLTTVAYFSMEFMLCEALPIYSGGLGNVAGDQLKAASDLGVPVVGVGLLYQQGYFRQVIDHNGAQQALYPYNDPGQLPISPLRNADGEWIRIEIRLPGYSVWLRAWQVKVGRVKLLLLDSNDAANFPAHRGITSELYGGNSELRLKQELILGIGGWRLLETLGLKPEVCHLNEGHAAFAVLERARSFMRAAECSFQEALTATRSGTLFTTHTAVPAGFDRFSPELIEQYLGNYTKNELNITIQELLALGRENPHDGSEFFNMAYLALRGSGAVNGVSQLHGKVSRQIFSSLFPRWSLGEVPIGYVTNGVHMPSWDSRWADKVWTDACGKERWHGTIETLEAKMRGVPDTILWKMRNEGRSALIRFARETLARQLAASGESIELSESAKRLFDPHTLTLGFARRFATYKRPNMLLYNPERLIRILTNPKCPVQLIVAGKAHPADKPGQALIQEWTHFIMSRPEARAHIIFLSDYDMHLTEYLVQGVDVWINNPKRPWEACGTSGMKVLVNGGINVSELDGWWAEAYAPEVGWALGDGQEHDNDPRWDATEANRLYDLLEREVVPMFYKRDAEGQPLEWIAKMRESMARLTPRYSANRAVREYTEDYYLPAAAAFSARKANGGALSKQILSWKQQLQEKWSSIRFSSQAKVETANGQHRWTINCYLDDLDPNFIQVELYGEGTAGGSSEIYVMTRNRELSGTPHFYEYSMSIPSKRQTSDYTPRIIPHYPGAIVPLETQQILWYS